MATRVFEARRLRDDHKLFLTLAIAMAVTIVAGFSMQLAMGRSSFAAPIHVHVHALVFFGWTTLYVVQTALVATGSRRLHRQLGWVGAGWTAAIVLVGLYTTAVIVREGRVPFFFTPAFFYYMDSLSVLCFGGLVTAAIRLRRRTEWHRRLITCAMAGLTGPAVGRLLPMPFMIPWAAWGVFAAIMTFPLAGMIADRRMRGGVHPAWWWGVGALAVTQVAMGVVAASPPGLALYRTIVAGTPGEGVAPLAYPAFPSHP